MLHVIERFVIHFAAAIFLTLAAFYAMRYWGMRNCKVRIFLSGRKSHLLVTSALVVFAIAPLREPFDVFTGNNTFIKSCFDQLSWMLGAAVAAWGLYRFQKTEVSAWNL